MDIAGRRDLTLIPLTLLLALIVDQIALPVVLNSLRPQLTILVLLFWCLFAPQWVGVSVAWFLGLFVDVLSGGLLGGNALTFSLAGYLILMLHQQVRVLPLMQQSLIVFLVLALARLLLLVTLVVTGTHVSVELFYSAMSGALIWSAVVVVMQRWRINQVLSR